MTFNDYRKESTRRQSFYYTVLNTQHFFPDMRRLAAEGFYYAGPRDLTRCFVCNVKITKWFHGDNVRRVHLRASPDCPFANRRDSCGNIPITVEELDAHYPTFMGVIGNFIANMVTMFSPATRRGTRTDDVDVEKGSAENLSIRRC